MSTFNFVWHTREKERREFSQLLMTIAFTFRDICGIGSNTFWKDFQANVKINRVLELYTAMDDNKEMDYRSGFVAIKEGYQCVPHPNRKGYALCTYGNPKTWYIDLICSKNDMIKGKGVAMLEEVRREAIANNIEYITLSALPYVILYYAKVGFQLTMDTSCVEDTELHALSQKIMSNLKKYQYKSINDPFEQNDEDFMNLLKLAVVNGLAHGRQSTGSFKVDECDGVDCTTDGVYMTLCLPKKTYEFFGEPPSKRRRLAPPEVPIEKYEDFNTFMVQQYGNKFAY